MRNPEELEEELANYKKREKELKSRIEELTDFLENATIALHWVDSEGIIIWANQDELDFLGYTKEEYIGFPVKKFHADQETINDILTRLSKGEIIRNYPARLLCKDRSVKHVLINSNVFRKDGKFIYTRCFTRDVTELLKEQEDKEVLLTELKESEARLRMAVVSTKLGTWDYNPQSGKLNWSEVCKNIYGLPADAEVDFGVFAEHIHPDDREYVQQAIKRSIDPAGDGSYDITYRILRFDDQGVRWIRAQGEVYLNADKEADRFIGTVIDITESKLAIERINKSEKLFRSIAMNIPNSLIIVIDTQQRFILVEGDIMEKFGYDRNNYEGKHPSDVLPPGRYENSKTLFERVLAGEKFSEERKAASGEDFIVHMVPLKDENDEVYAGLIISMDITDFKKAEAGAARMAAIVHSSDDAIISKTTEGIITSWNEAAERMFGYRDSEIIGKSVLTLIPPDRSEEEPLILARLRKGERVEHFETKRITKDNKILDISLTISPIRDSRNNIIGFSKIARDITSKKLEERRKNDFIAMVSHELKTPLTSVKSYIQVLLAKARKEEKNFDINALSRAEIQTNKMTSMINDFLSLARLEEGKIHLHKVNFELHPVFEDMVHEARFLASGHTVKLQDCERIMIHADKDKIVQVLINLLSNAIKYSHKGSSVTMGCTRKDGKVRIYVRDEGIGISHTDQKRLFERFYRVENDKLKNVSGFGIGLYLCSEILRYHGCKIKVDSKEDEGSTFYFEMDEVSGKKQF